MSDEFNPRGFIYEWRIENFSFCWHKTGEYLESPIFHTESSGETSWRLRLYPRGEDDGEYISCYLFRSEGGPEVVDVDFELFIFVGGILIRPPMSFDKIYSLKNGETEGEKAFVRRKEIFSRQVAHKEHFTLVFGCNIFNEGGKRLEEGKHYGRTTIAMEYISGMEINDGDELINSENHPDIEVKPLLEDNPFISINLLYFNESLVIKIHPKNCEKIRFATCKITIIKHWEKENPIVHFRYWIGEMKEDIWRYDLPLPQKDAEQDAETSVQKTFFLHYNFGYSIGVEYSSNELNDYGTDLWIEDFSLLEPPPKFVKNEEPSGYLTAVETVKSLYTSNSFTDLNIGTRKKTCSAHKAILRARSSKLYEMLKDNPESIEILNFKDDVVRRFLEFLYTDNVEDLFWPVTIELYQMAAVYKVDLLRQICVKFLKKNLNFKNVSELLSAAVTCEDLPLKGYVQKYIIEHDEEVFSTDEWQVFAENQWKLAEECMLWKYENKM
ncbi:TD and POZ domain-containing protein 3 [Argiope bruennichi]|uniref:TD and POZ domain-containing protein 3 n=1 Tax=Argiope bruennichi TaxID=94029 RepID=A0A8T0EQU0_ARGBR|nr:TD and POZ domain-containing protein 3 [Argiope bruennichi]